MSTIHGVVPSRMSEEFTAKVKARTLVRAYRHTRMEIVITALRDFTGWRQFIQMSLLLTRIRPHLPCLVSNREYINIVVLVTKAKEN